MRSLPGYLGMFLISCLVCLGARQAVAKEDLMGKVMVGDITVFILSDGYRDLDAKLFLTPDPRQQAAVQKIYPQGRTRNSLNTFLIKTGKEVVLVDTGGGVLLGPDAGGLPKALAAAGVSPEEVTRVVITHVHRDHIGGLAAAGKAAFPGATIHLAKVERDFWLNPDNEAKSPERARPNFAVTRDMLALYPGKVLVMEPGQEVAPGVGILAAYGHTPGHVAVLVHSKGHNLLLWGDLLHGLDLQLARPDIAIAFDFDPVAAVAARKALLARAAKEGWSVTGVHVPRPAAYRIKPAGEGFALVP